MVYFNRTIFKTLIASFLNLLIITSTIMCAEINSYNASSSPSQHFRAFIKCRETIQNLPDGWNGVDPYCKWDFDGIGCWNAALKDTVSEIPCPDYISGSLTQNYAIRKCIWNGTWQPNQYKNEGDYSKCNFDAHIQTVDENQLTDILQEMEKLEKSPYSDIHVARAFENCIDTMLVQPKIKGVIYCPRTFDGWACFNDTLAGHVAYISCPDFIPGFSSDKIAHKICTESGTWYQHFMTNRTWSNYTSCVDEEDYAFRQKIINLYISGYSISLVALLVSIVIFFSFKSLSSQTRIRIHKNLFVSFIINNMMWIIWYCAVVNDANVLLQNGFTCQALHVVVHYFMVCNYFWMFCEGLYLHTLLVIAFVAENKILKWFYILGWGVPVPLTIIYAFLRSRSQDTKDTQYCWIDNGIYNWLLTGPVCLSLLLNLFFLINIVRVLVTKLRAVNTSDTHQTRKAVRATLILIPLLGLQFILTPFRPETKSTAESVYEIVSAIVTSLQGLCVAMLFCFFNGEVLAHLRKKWNQVLLSHGIGSDRRMSYAATTVSYVHKYEDIEAKNKEKVSMLRER